MLSKPHIEQLLDALRTGKIDISIAALGSLAASRCYADAVRLMEQCSNSGSRDRERMRAMLVDLISRYPKVIWSAPVLLHVQTNEIAMLTLPDIDASDVAENVISACWLPIRQAWSCDASPKRAILTNTSGCALLMAQTDGDDPPMINDKLLSRIFDGIQLRGNIRWGIGPVLPNPEGIEAGFLMSAIIHRLAGSGLPTTPSYFMRDAGWKMAVEAALRFSERSQASSKKV